jgi:hypothetical protein
MLENASGSFRFYDKVKKYPKVASYIEEKIEVQR